MRSIQRAARLAPWSLPAAAISLTGYWFAFHADLTRFGFLAAMAAFQGFEFLWCGVIIGPDLVVRNGK